jgi:ankyrin repeat protein
MARMELFQNNGFERILENASIADIESIIKDHVGPDGIDNFYPIKYACKFGHLDIFCLMFESSRADNCACLTFLKVAIEAGHFHIFDMILKISSKNFDTISMVPFENISDGFIQASELGRAEMVKRFIAVYPEFIEINRKGRNALLAASEKGHAPVVSILLAAGANINHTDSERVSSLYAASKNGHLDTVNLLLSMEGLNMDLTTKKRNSALMAASICGHLDVATALLDAGADVNHKNKRKIDALYMACQQGHVEIVKLLIDNGANNFSSAYFDARASKDEEDEIKKILFAAFAHKVGEAMMMFNASGAGGSNLD